MKVIRLYNCGLFTKDCVGPDSTRSFVWSTGLIFANIVTVEYYSIPSWEVLARWPHFSEGRVSKKWSPPIVPFFDRVDLLKNSSRSKIVVPWSSWSSDDGAYTQSTLRTTLDRERQTIRTLQRVGGTRGPSGDPRTTKMTTDRRFLIGYCFSAGQLGQKRGRLEAIQDDNRADQKHWFIGNNLVKAGLIGKNQSLVKWPFNIKLPLVYF